MWKKSYISGEIGPSDSDAVCGRIERSPYSDAVRSRIDWKYALGLELTDPGFDQTVLKYFR